MVTGEKEVRKNKDKLGAPSLSLFLGSITESQKNRLSMLRENSSILGCINAIVKLRRS